jgi:hypothetical protein
MPVTKPAATVDFPAFVVMADFATCVFRVRSDTDEMGDLAGRAGLADFALFQAGAAMASRRSNSYDRPIEDPR